MARVLPPPGFANASLHLHTVAAGLRFGRIYLGTYPDPLGFGKTPSRFSDPRRRKFANRFGVLYLGDTVKVCFLEAVLRDQRDGVLGDLPIAESELYDRNFAEIEVSTPLMMVDFRDDGRSRWVYRRMSRRAQRPHQPCSVRSSRWKTEGRQHDEADPRAGSG